MSKKTLSIGLLILFFVSSHIAAQTSPEEFLGHKVGADHKLADYNQILAYFKKLDEESEKIKVLTIGETVLKKPMILAVITAEENMANLDKYRDIAKRLRDARDLDAEEARQLAKEGKVLLCITCSQHALKCAIVYRTDTTGRAI